MTNKKSLIILLLFVSAVTLLEMINLTKVSLWHDEAFSALLVRYDFSEMISRIKLDVHPPLYYIFLKGWTGIFTDSLFSLRMFSVFSSFLSIFGLYFLVNKAFKNRALALFASLLYALSYFQIQYAMEARMYSLGTFLVILSSYLLLTALERKKPVWWIFYAIAVSLGLYIHYFTALWIMAQATYLIFFFRKEFKSALLAYSLVSVSYIPWLPTFFRQFNQVQETFWIPAMNIWSIPNTFSKMILGAAVDSSQYWPILVLLAILIIAAAVFFMKKNGAKEKWLFLIQLFLPFILAAVLSYKRSVFTERYFIFGFPFFILIWAGAILAIKQKALKLILALLVLAGVSATFPFQWKILNVDEKPGMAAAAKYVNENAEPNEKIFIGSSLIYFAFKYYNKSGIPAKLYAPEPMPHFSGTALLSEEDIIADFGKEAKKGDFVWMINTTGFGNYQPTLPENWLKEDEKGFQELNAYQGWVIVLKYKVE